MCEHSGRVHQLTDPPATAELVVIGSGIVGAATAFYAARAGLSVVVVERRPALCSLTTAVAAGGYRLQLEHREELDLVRRSVALFEDFAEATGQRLHDPGLRRQGYLWLARSDDTAARQAQLVEHSGSGAWTGSSCWTATRRGGGSRGCPPTCCRLVSGTTTG